MKSSASPWAFRLAVFLFLSSSLCLPCSARSAPHPSPSGKPATATPPTDSAPALSGDIAIPGPLPPFLRMAAISQRVSSRDVLPLLAHNVTAEGYRRAPSRRGYATPQATTYLTLLERYVEQARELKALAGPEDTIRVSKCSQAHPLLTALGYRLTQPCGPNTSLEAADPERAFLTADSGFPLAQLERTLRENKPFVYSFPSSKVPVLFSRGAWEIKDQNKTRDVLEVLLHDPARARLYWALAQTDESTRTLLWKDPGLDKLLPFAPVLDYYGSLIRVRSGRVVVPGGASADSAWENLVGASPASPEKFIMRLLKKDDGWLAAYFDALSRADPARQAYFTARSRLRLFYEALRGKKVYPGPARPLFRMDPGLALLATQLSLEPGGQPRIPGGLEVWETVARRNRKYETKAARKLAKRAGSWTNPDQLIAFLFATSRMETKNTPLQLFMILSAMDRGRPAGERLTPQTVLMLADKFERFGDQYRIFTEFKTLSNQSIANFFSVAEFLDRIHDSALRANAIGIFQANVGLWQILARQKEIPQERWNQSWQKVVSPFAGFHSSVQLFDAAQSSLEGLWKSAAGDSRLSQDGLIDLLAGPEQLSPQGQQVKATLAARMLAVLSAQRLVSLDTLLDLGDGLRETAEGKMHAKALLPLAGQLREFQMPEPLLPKGDRLYWPYGLYNNHHILAETQPDLAKSIRSGLSAHKLAEARGQLVPFLRDTLVGLNYAYYAPPGAQMLYNNPLFVRGHDFSAQSGMLVEETTWQTPRLSGRGYPKAGGAHLVGSLANLPYVLASVEQNFIVPQHVQALIWEDLVPTFLTDAIMPRWWQVTPHELHAVTLYQLDGEELLTAAASNEDLRQKVMTILSACMLPRRADRVAEDLRTGHPHEAISRVTPGDTFYLAAQFRQRFPQESGAWGKAGKELNVLTAQYPKETNLERLSRDFGVPHPAIEQTYGPSLLTTKPFPTYQGYSSRLLAESWDSNNLYWARLADENGYPPVMLNLLVPELTHVMVENIFATYLGDWPSLLRALRETGKEFQQGKIASLPKPSAAPPL